jgi:hypothetical protein
MQHRLWSALPPAPHFYPPETIARMMHQEAHLYPDIQKWIKEQVARR